MTGGASKIGIKYPVIVEGKYDKIKLSSIFDAKIITTDGFGVFSNEDKKKMFISLSEITPLIIATDPDGAGLVIRNYFRGIIKSDRLFHVYVPSLKGKEKRKDLPSKEGTLGVEGMTKDTLLKLFEPYFKGENETIGRGEILSCHFYEMGLSGGDNSRDRRRFLCERLSLPTNLSSRALMQAVGMLYDRETIAAVMSEYDAK